MTNTTPTPGNDTGLPALLAHIDDCQGMAMHLLGLLEALAFIDNEKPTGGSQVAPMDGPMTSMIDIAVRMARDLNNALDIARLPEVKP